MRLPDILDPESTEPQPVPEIIKAQSEDDIIDPPAAITYVRLKQLTEYLLLSIAIWTLKDPLTFVECQTLDDSRSRPSPE